MWILFWRFRPVRLHTLLSLPLGLLLCFFFLRHLLTLCRVSPGGPSSQPAMPSFFYFFFLSFYLNLSVCFLCLSLPTLLSLLLYPTYFLWILCLCRHTCEPFCLLIKLPNRGHSSSCHYSTDPPFFACSSGTYMAENNNKSDRRKNNYMTDNLSPVTNSTSPRQTELAEACLLHCCEPHVGLTWRLQKPAAHRAERHVHSRAREDNICIIHALSDPCALLNSIIYTLFPPWLPPLKKKKKRERKCGKLGAVSQIDLNMYWRYECGAAFHCDEVTSLVSQERR